MKFPMKIALPGFRKQDTKLSQNDLQTGCQITRPMKGVFPTPDTGPLFPYETDLETKICVDWHWHSLFASMYDTRHLTSARHWHSADSHFTRMYADQGLVPSMCGTIFEPTCAYCTVGSYASLSIRLSVRPSVTLLQIHISESIIGRSLKLYHP